MAIPKKVQEQAEAAERMAREAGMKGAPKLAEVDDPKAQPAPQDVVPAQPPVDQRQPVNVPPAQQDQKVDPENWKERYTRFRQKYESEVPALRETNLRLTGQVEVLTKQVESLLAQAKNPTPSSQPDGNTGGQTISKEKILSVLTEKEREEYSDEFIDMLGRVATAISQPVQPKVDPQIVSRVDNLEKTAQETKADRFWKAIDLAHPTWAEIQETEAFQEYLTKYDRKLKMTNGAALQRAQENLDSETAIAVFDDFINKAPVPPPPPPQDPRAKYVMPNESAPGQGSDLDSSSPKMSEKQISQFYTDVANGKYRNRPQEAAAIEQAIRKQVEAAKRRT